MPDYGVSVLYAAYRAWWLWKGKHVAHNCMDHKRENTTDWFHCKKCGHEWRRNPNGEWVDDTQPLGIDETRAISRRATRRALAAAVMDGEKVFYDDDTLAELVMNLRRCLAKEDDIIFSPEDGAEMLSFLLELQNLRGWAAAEYKARLQIVERGPLVPPCPKCCSSLDMYLEKDGRILCAKCDPRCSGFETRAEQAGRRDLAKVWDLEETKVLDEAIEKAVLGHDAELPNGCTLRAEPREQSKPINWREFI